MGRPPKKVSRTSKSSKEVASHDVPWDDAIRRVLAEADGALHYTDIADRIISNGLRISVGATPPQTVASRISTSLREDAASPYLKVDKGTFTLRDIALRKISAASTEQVESRNGDTTAESGALRAFGMYWERKQVNWSSTKLLGRQGPAATEVNFAEQVGVYLLHDRDRVIYVGRATDTLFVRLKAHTADRLAGRWDRFSWFGIRNVESSGAISDTHLPWSHIVVVETMEALLIESLEPPLNRRRGDNFSAIEYIQAEDPEFSKAKRQKLLIDAITRS